MDYLKSTNLILGEETIVCSLPTIVHPSVMVNMSTWLGRGTQILGQNTGLNVTVKQLFR